MKNILLLFLLGLGLPLIVSSQASIVMGTSEATGQNATAFGENSEAVGITSVAIGRKARARGDYSLSLGDNTFTGADATGSVALGTYNNALARHSTTIGMNNNISSGAFSSTALGASNIIQSTGYGSVALGLYNQIDASATVVLGSNNYANSYGEIVLGAYADTTSMIHAPDGLTWHPEDRLLSIANGYGNNLTGTYSNALTMYKNGNTDMIGNLSIAQRINIGDDIDSLAVGELGDIRFNNRNGDFEGYTLYGWQSLTAVDVTASRAASGEWVQKTNTKKFGNAFSQFLKFNSLPIMGEVPTGDFQNQIEIYDFEIPFEGAAKGFDQFRTRHRRAEAPEFTFIKPGDLSSTEFYELIANGERVQEIEISWSLDDVDDSQVFAKYSFSNVIFTSIEHFFDIDMAQDLNRIKFKSGQIKIEYYTEKNGSFTKVNEAIWDYQENRPQY